MRRRTSEVSGGEVDQPSPTPKESGGSNHSEEYWTGRRACPTSGRGRGFSSSCRCCSSPPQALAAKSRCHRRSQQEEEHELRHRSVHFCCAASLPLALRSQWSFATRPYPEHGGTQDPLQEFGGRPTHGEGSTRAPTPEHPVSRDKKEGRGLTTPALFTLSDPPERVRLTRWLSRWPARWCLRPARWLSRQPPWRSTGQE
jgi:hypothetical protein